MEVMYTYDLAAGTKLLNLTADSMSFFSGTPATRPSAYTQTYSTATKTVAAVTSNTITDSTGGSVSTTALAAQTLPTALTHAVGTADATVDDVGGAFNQTTLNNNFKEVTTTFTAILAQLTALRNAIATLAAESALVKADLLSTKKNLNSVIDDLQAVNLVG